MSTDPTTVDRRRVPRVELEPGLECRLEVRTRIRMVDISLSGALLASESQLPIGTRGFLTTGVGSAPFAPEVQVRRVVAGEKRDPGMGLGAAFVGMDEKSRRNLEEFLRKASE